eukprot:NODE_648_length_5041_cov_0.519021.p1 type:complete len:442 gc:universal NODE_648_length_5041_cov_0.519021:3626-2301(-)
MKVILTHLGNIFIKNLHPDIDHKALHDTFSQFGKIISCKVATANGQSKGYGFVHFESKEDALNAIQSVHLKYMNGQQVHVHLFIPKNERQTNDLFTNIYIKQFPKHWTDSDLELIFKEYGAMTSVFVNGQGVAFINYEDHESANSALQLNDVPVKELIEKHPELKSDQSDANGESNLPDLVLYVSPAQKKQQRQANLSKQHELTNSTNCYIKNIDDQMSDTQLMNEFKVFGEITSCKIMRDANQRSKGFGFVSFTNSDEACKAVTEMNGKIVGSKPLYVALAQRKEQRRMQLEQQYRERMNVVRPLGMRPMRPLQGLTGVSGMNRGMGGMARPLHTGHGGQMSRPIGRPGQLGGAALIDTPSGVKLPLPLAQVAQMDEMQAKKMIGNSLFGYIRPMEPELVSKLVGMVLQMELSDVIELLGDHDKLMGRIEEGVTLLKSKK